MRCDSHKNLDEYRSRYDGNPSYSAPSVDVQQATETVKLGYMTQHERRESNFEKTQSLRRKSRERGSMDCANADLQSGSRSPEHRYRSEEMQSRNHDARGSRIPDAFSFKPDTQGHANLDESRA